jgi:hypothetical protein
MCGYDVTGVIYLSLWVQGLFSPEAGNSIVLFTLVSVLTGGIPHLG